MEHSSSSSLQAGAGRALLFNRQLIWFSLLIVIISAFLLPLGYSATNAEPESDWSRAVLLFEGNKDVAASAIAADRSGGVHVFWMTKGWGSDGTSEPDVQPDLQLAYYTRWDGKEWTKPVDIIAGQKVNLSSATADSGGYIHLMWQRGLNQLTYSRVKIAEAATARSWASPAAVDVTHEQAYITVDSNGRLHRVYPGMLTLGPHYQVSEDGGVTWSTPVNISPTSSPQSAANWVRMAVADNGDIHAVWTEWQLPTGWPSSGVYYSRSRNGGRSWSPPVKLAGEGYNQINVGVVGDNVVHVAWNGMVGIGGRYHRWSSDGGDTWSKTSMITSGGFTEGPPQLAVDSAGTLHMLYTADQRVWYTYWQGERWSTPVYIPTGDRAADQTSDQYTRNIESVVLTISSGNRLHAAFWDRRLKEHVSYIWYVTKQTGAPAVIPEPPFAPDTDSATPLTSLPTTVPAVEPSQPVNVASVDPSERERSLGPSWVMFMAVWPAALVVGIILFKRAWDRGR